MIFLILALILGCFVVLLSGIDQPEERIFKQEKKEMKELSVDAEGRTIVNSVTGEVLTPHNTHHRL